MFFWNKICVIGLFFVMCDNAYGQVATHLTLKATDFILKQTAKTWNQNQYFNLTNAPIAVTQQISASVQNKIPQDYYTKNFGFFCKQELRVEKAIKIPLRFRLGSLQQCNYYEGKR
ncbi:MAG: hypothetical protein ABJA90_12055 [Ginsengibacter sp.]